MFFDAVVGKPPIIETTTPLCGKCGIWNRCQSPKMPTTGRGERGILVVGEAPGETEDEQNEQFVGQSGQLLRESMSAAGLDLDRDCWKTNALICRPPGNRTPTEDEIGYCRPNLNRTIKDLNPRVVVLLGGVAVRSFLEPIWGPTGPIATWVGWRIPLQSKNCWVCPTYHPSYVKRSEDQRGGEVIRRIFDRQLKSIEELVGRPWKEVPDYRSQITIEKSPSRASTWLSDKLKKGGACSFDFETNCLKPDGDDAAIVSCAVCWSGKETIAFPWAGEAIEAMGKFLQSEVPKIGANNKFESRWTYKEFGFYPRNWVHDCQLDAHILDNRRGIVSVEFQSFVRLGFPPWGDVSPYLKASGGNDINRIRELDLGVLLEYNALDALCEYFVAVDQRKELKKNEVR